MPNEDVSVEHGSRRGVNHFHAREMQSMASKLNLMTFLQQARGLTEG